AVLVERGEGWLETQPSGRIGLKGGHLFWLFPTVRHAYAPDAGGWFERWVLFEGEQAAAFERLGLLDPKSPVVEVSREPQINAMFDELHRDFLGGGTTTTLLGASSVHRLVALVSALKARQQIESSYEDIAFMRVIRHIEANVCGDLDLESLAEDAGMASSTFRRRFHRAMGCSPKEYVLRCRLSLAKERLTLTRRDIAAIALEAGFKDPFYFSRLFKRKEGMSPRLFRQQYWRGGGTSE
ncbi:MAG: AraC family transcriptional regulator, partial [Chloroflexota bacterium]